MRLGSEVYEIMLRKLVSLDIQPGDRISVDSLARELGVSQTPIREALSQLEIQGLVVKVHLSGYRAAPQLTAKQFDDLCELRMLLEPFAAARAAEQMGDQELAEVGALAERMKEPRFDDPQSAYSAFAQEDAEFHSAIARGSHNDLLPNMVIWQRVHLHLFRLRYYAWVIQAAVDEHATIVEALSRRDPDAAAEAMRSHIRNAHARFKKAYES